MSYITLPEGSSTNLSRRGFDVLALTGVARAQRSRRPPNILFILADDFGWNAPGCYGNKDVATPNLDRLAREGVRLTAAYAEPQCSPTRAALLSGQYGARTGVFKVIHEKEPPNTPLTIPKANLALEPSVATLAAALRSAGYTTGIAGKWHIADHYAAADARQLHGGRYFDRYGFDFASPVSERQFREDKAVTALTDEVIGFIERAGERPWFAYLAHFTTHTRLAAPRELVDRHAARGYRRTSAPNARFAERPTAEYLAMIEHLDNETGRLLDRLDRLGVARNTLVVFTSDNGGLSRMASMAPLREGKGALYEGGVRVPLIVRWPGRAKAGSSCDTPVHTIDHYPTLLDAAGAKAPAGHKLDGVSMIPMIEGKAPPRRQALYWYTPTYTLMYGRTPCSWIRAGDWKLIHWFGDYLAPEGYTPDDRTYGKLVTGPRWVLYNLKDDPGESRDRSAAEPARAAELRRRLEAWWAETGAQTPTRNPDFDPAKWVQ